jgi:protein-S-isoprenylcysteine O-methyltransferase Ste14
MNFKIITIIVIVYFYGLFEYYVYYQQKKKLKIVRVRDRGSLWLIVVSITVGYLFSFSIAATKIGRIYYWDILFVIGLLIIAIGLVVRVISIRQLGQYFTYSVSEVENHILVEKGLYKFIRHPGYLGQLLIFTGISISLSNWLSIILMLISTFIGYMNRIRVEEKFMVEQMGDKYSNYKKRTNKLIPKIY